MVGKCTDGFINNDCAGWTERAFRRLNGQWLCGRAGFYVFVRYAYKQIWGPFRREPLP